MSGSGIRWRWAICKSAPWSRQITTPAPHPQLSFFTGRTSFLPPNQQCQSTNKPHQFCLHKCSVVKFNSNFKFLSRTTIAFIDQPPGKWKVFLAWHIVDVFLPISWAVWPTWRGVIQVSVPLQFLKPCWCFNVSILHHCSWLHLVHRNNQLLIL